MTRSKARALAPPLRRIHARNKNKLNRFQSSFTSRAEIFDTIGHSSCVCCTVATQETHISTPNWPFQPQPSDTRRTSGLGSQKRVRWRRTIRSSERQLLIPRPFGWTSRMEHGITNYPKAEYSCTRNMMTSSISKNANIVSLEGSHTCSLSTTQWATVSLKESMDEKKKWRVPSSL